MKPEALNLLYALNTYDYRDDIKIIGACKNDNSIDNISEFRELHEADYSFSTMDNLGSKYPLFNSAFALIDGDHILQGRLSNGVKQHHILQLLEKAQILSQSDITVEDISSGFTIDSITDFNLDEIFSSTEPLNYTIKFNSNSPAIGGEIIDNSILQLTPLRQQRESFITLKAEIDENRNVCKTINFYSALDCTIEDFESGSLGDFIFEFDTDEENPWIVSEKNPYLGSRSLITPENLPIGETSSLFANVNVTGSENQKFEFFYRVIGGTAGDVEFAIYVDGEFLMFWSGDVPWDKYTIVLSEGSHDIEWRFTRSETSSNPNVFAQIDCATLSQINSSVVEELNITDYSLITSYPNPFNPTTTLQFHRGLSEMVRANIFNSSGEIVKSFEFQSINGINSLNLDLHGYNSGIYFVMLKDQKGSIIGSQKLTLIK